MDTTTLIQQYGHLALGSGNRQTHGIVLVADMPGEKELLDGIPFSGASGKLLDSLLNSIGLEREQLYLTNIIKFRPIKRLPTKQEINDFMPLLIEELTSLTPAVVVSLGSLSLNAFLPGMKISDIHGQAIKLTWQNLSFSLMPLYHPAAALHNGKMRPILKADMLALGALLEELNLN